MSFEEWLEYHEEWRPYVDLLVKPPSYEEVATEFPETVGAKDDLFIGGEDTWMTFGMTRAAAYVQMRRHDPSIGHRFALMIVCQKPPGGMTDSIFFEGAKRLGDQYSERYAERITSVAQANGYNPSPNDQYFPGLARFQGDPEAFISQTAGRGAIKSICEKRGWACEGAVKVAHREPEACPYETAPKLAPDLVAANAAKFAADNPGEAAKMSKKDIVDHVTAVHGNPD